MRDDITGPGRNQPTSSGQYCPNCGRHEPDSWARFCGSCGGTLDAPGASDQPPAYDAAQVTHRPAVSNPYSPAQTAHLTPAAAPYPTAYMPPPAATHGGAPEPLVYRIPSVGYGGAARIGAAIAAALSLLPCLGMAFVGTWGIHELRVLFDSWVSASVRVPALVTSIDVSMNFIDLLKLRPVYDFLIAWDDRLWITFAILWLVPWIASILVGVLFALVLALIYNTVGATGGGMRVSVVPEQSAAQPWASQSPYAAPPTWPVEGRR